MASEGLKELYVEELKDIYNAENQLVKALPKLAKAADSKELREGFQGHLEQTKAHVARLEQIFAMLEESPKGKKCTGMEGLVEEGSEVMKEGLEGAVLDAALIGAAQRVEHYEIAAYGTVIAFAQTLGETDHVALLEETLSEERETDEKLTELAKQINEQALSGDRIQPAADEASGKKRAKRIA
jgi:ferritin-like metal-binding protein YciE